MTDTSRNFVIEFCAVEGLSGIFKGKTPGQAAKKVACKLFKLTPRSQEVKFKIRETTQGSAKKVYTYIGTKHVFPEPKVIKRGNVEITITAEYKVKQA